MRNAAVLVLCALVVGVSCSRGEDPGRDRASETEAAEPDYRAATAPSNALPEKVSDTLDDIVSPGGRNHDGIGLMGDEEGKADTVEFGFGPDGRMRPADGAVAIMLREVTIEEQTLPKGTKFKRVSGWWVRLPATK